MSAAHDLGIAPAPMPAKPPVTLPSGNPGRVLGDCKRVALRADWKLVTWQTFRDEATRCLTPDAQPDEHARFMAVVEKYFAVTRGPAFSDDPSQWRHVHHEPTE